MLKNSARLRRPLVCLADALDELQHVHQQLLEVQRVPVVGRCGSNGPFNQLNSCSSAACRARNRGPRVTV